MVSVANTYRISTYFLIDPILIQSRNYLGTATKKSSSYNLNNKRLTFQIQQLTVYTHKIRNCCSISQLLQAFIVAGSICAV